MLKTLAAFGLVVLLSTSANATECRVIKNHVADQSSALFGLESVSIGSNKISFIGKNKSVIHDFNFKLTNLGTLSTEELNIESEQKSVRYIFSYSENMEHYVVSEWTKSMVTANEFALTHEVRLNCQE